MMMLCCFIMLPLSAQAMVPLQRVKHGELTALLAENHQVPAIHVQLTFRDAGYASDPADRQGRAKMVASMLMEGTTAHDSLAFHQAMEEKAISIGVQAGRDQLTIELQTLAEHRDAAFALLAQMLTSPRFDAAALERLRARMQVTLKQAQEQPGWQANRAWMKQMVGAQHPYAQSARGTQASIAAMTVDDLRGFHQRYMTRDNLLVSVAGAMDERQVRYVLKKHLTALPKVFQPEREVEPATLPDEGSRHVVTMEAAQQTVLFGLPGIARHDPDFYAAYVLNHIVGGGSSLTSRLGQVMRKDKGLVYGVDSWLDVGPNALFWQGAFTTGADTEAQAIDALKSVIDAVATQGVTQQEVQDAVRYLTGSFPLNLDSNARIANYLTVIQWHHLGIDYLQKRNQLFEQVTVAQINKVAKQLLDASRLTVVTAGSNVAE